VKRKRIGHVRRRAKRNATSRVYDLKKSYAMPGWADKEAIERFYVEAREMTIRTGVKHQVDHVIPLKHKLVCGLHVPANLQVITATENLRKKNSFNPD
jgi:hypothetical protein